MTRLVFAALLLLCIGTQVRAADLSLKRVMLSSGGVGYFEYAADVDGDDTLGLDVPLDQVDDILKSLVVFDSAGGVASVELPGRDNTIQAFADAPFGPEALESASAYLNALIGTEVNVRGPVPMTGRIVRAEPETETTDKTSTQQTRVTLLTTDGLRQFLLEHSDTVQVVNPVLRARIEQALESLRRDAGNTTRHLTIRIKGKGAVEGDLSDDARAQARRDREAAGLGNAGKSVRRGLERRDSDVAIRQSGHVPAGAVSQLFRATAGGAGRNSRSRAAGRRHRSYEHGAARCGGDSDAGRARDGSVRANGDGPCSASADGGAGGTRASR
jgi:hypothetical protein